MVLKASEALEVLPAASRKHAWKCEAAVTGEA